MEKLYHFIFRFNENINRIFLPSVYLLTYSYMFSLLLFLIINKYFNLFEQGGVRAIAIG